MYEVFDSADSHGGVGFKVGVVVGWWCRVSMNNKGSWLGRGVKSLALQ